MTDWEDKAADLTEELLEKAHWWFPSDVAMSRGVEIIAEHLAKAATEKWKAIPASVLARDEQGPPLPQMVAQRRAQLEAEAMTAEKWKACPSCGATHPDEHPTCSDAYHVAHLLVPGKPGVVSDPAEKWKAKAHETLTRASVRSGQKPATRLHYDTLYEIKVDEIAAALAEAYTEGRDDEWGRTERVD